MLVKCYALNIKIVCNLKMLRVGIVGLSKGILGSYLNRGMPNRILKYYN
jgi:hypothetical protein